MEDFDDDTSDTMEFLAQIQAIFTKYFRNNPTSKISFEMTLDTTSPTSLPTIRINNQPLTPDDLQRIFHLFTHLDSPISSSVPNYAKEMKNNQPLQIILEKKEESLMRDYLVDIFDDDRMISVIIELPGVSKKDISLNTLSSKEIEITSPSYQRVIDLPAEIDPNHVRARYHNGILEISLKKRNPSSTKKNIIID